MNNCLWRFPGVSFPKLWGIKSPSKINKEINPKNMNRDEAYTVLLSGDYISHKSFAKDSNFHLLVKNDKISTGDTIIGIYGEWYDAHDFIYKDRAGSEFDSDWFIVKTPINKKLSEDKHAEKIINSFFTDKREQLEKAFYDKLIYGADISGYLDYILNNYIKDNNMGNQEFGICDICGKEAALSRTYFHYNIPCECCGCKEDGKDMHFEMVKHCKDCVPEMPTEIHPLLKDNIGHGTYHASIRNILPYSISGEYIIKKGIKDEKE